MFFLLIAVAVIASDRFPVFLSEGGREAAAKLKEDMDLFFPTTKIGKVRIKVTKEGKVQSRFSPFLSSEDATGLYRWMKDAIETKNESYNPIMFLGCENVSEYARSVVGRFKKEPTVDECIQSFKKMNLFQFEFHVTEYNGQMHQAIAVTTDLATPGPLFASRTPLSHYTKVLVRSDSWDSILRSGIFPVGKEFSPAQAKMSLELLGNGRYFHKKPTDLVDLSNTFFNDQRNRMGMHAVGVALEVFGAIYFFRDLTMQASIASGLRQTGKQLVSRYSVTATIKSGFLSDSVVLGGRIGRAILAKNIIMQATNVLASVSLTIHALHIEQMLDYIDNDFQRELLDNAIHIIHTTMMIVGISNGAMNIFSHVGRHDYIWDKAYRAMVKNMQNAAKVVREHRIAHAVSQAVGKPIHELNPAFWNEFWKKVKFLGGEWEALIDLTELYGHQHTWGIIATVLACPFDELLMSLPSILAGGKRFTHHSDKHDHADGAQAESENEMIKELPTESKLYKADPSEALFLLRSTVESIYLFESMYADLQQVDYSNALLFDKVKVRLWGSVSGKIETEEFECLNAIDEEKKENEEKFIVRCVTMKGAI